jgi:transketolase
LIAFIDCNGQQIDGSTDQVLSLGNIKAKWEAFGWVVLETNGNDLLALNTTIEEAKQLTGQGKPIMVLMTTSMGKGVDFMEGTHKWHGVAPNDQELANALSQLEETLGDY